MYKPVMIMVGICVCTSDLASAYCSSNSANRGHTWWMLSRLMSPAIGSSSTDQNTVSTTMTARTVQDRKTLSAYGMYVFCNATSTGDGLGVASNCSGNGLSTACTAIWH